MTHEHEHEHTTVDSELLCEYIGLVRALQHYIDTEPDRPVKDLTYQLSRVETALAFSEQMNEAHPLHHLDIDVEAVGVRHEWFDARGTRLPSPEGAAFVSGVVKLPAGG